MIGYSPCRYALLATKYCQYCDTSAAPLCSNGKTIGDGKNRECPPGKQYEGNQQVNILFLRPR